MVALVSAPAPCGSSRELVIEDVFRYHKFFGFRRFAFSPVLGIRACIFGIAIGARAVGAPDADDAPSEDAAVEERGRTGCSVSRAFSDDAVDVVDYSFLFRDVESIPTRVSSSCSCPLMSQPSSRSSSLISPGSCSLGRGNAPPLD